jgi:hypothetical protein
MGDTGTLLVTADGAGNIHLRRVKLGPTQEQIDEVVRLALEEQRRRGAPTRLELRAQALGAKLFNGAIPAGLLNGDFAELDGRVYRLVIKHGRNVDDVDERIATARIETGTHDVLTRGGGVEIGRDRVAPEVLQQFIHDFPAIAQIFVRRAVEHFIDEHESKTSGLRRVFVSAHNLGHAMVENHESMLLALVGLGITIAIPPLGILGVPWEIEAALGGVAALVAHDAKGALSDDLERRDRASLVRQHLDVTVRAKAIQSFDEWAHGLGKKRIRAKSHPVPRSRRTAQPPLPAHAGAATPRVLELTPRPAVLAPLPINAGAATPRVLALS